MSRLPTLAQAAVDLASGNTSSQALAEAALARIEDPEGEGARAFIHFDRADVLAQARASDLLRQHGRTRSALDGIPISIKDLFDVAGQVTAAGSVVLKDAAPATADCPVIARLKAAGAVLMGRTNMTEFAFSGIGMNPHYGTPGNPADRARIPGGSSSGAAVSAADGMAFAGIGTDTGGSVRIPSALCGLTGLKPTARRVPIDGVLPLSTSLDSIGPLAASVDCCARLDAVLAQQPYAAPAPRPANRMRFGVITNLVNDGIDDHVAKTYRTALDRLSAAGAVLEDVRIPALDELGTVNAKGGFAASEAYAWHRELLEKSADGYDPRVSGRIARGAAITGWEYIELLGHRRRLQADASAITRQFDAMLLPTVPVVAPRIADLADDDAYATQNMAMLRNSSVGNFLDRCGISLPIHETGTLPVGLMLMGETGADATLLDLAAGMEAVLAR
ncbi:MAG: amidase [Alphaproteobacteria bacterium]